MQSCLVVTASKMNGLTFLVVLALPVTCDIYMHDCFVLQQLNFLGGTCTPNYLRHLFARLLRSPATYLSCWYLHSQLPATSICTIASFSSNLTFLVVLALPITCDIYMHDCFVLQQLNFLGGTCTPNYLRHLYARLLRSPATYLSCWYLHSQLPATSICTIASFSSNLTFLVVLALPITCDIYMHDCFVLQQLSFLVGTCTPNYL